MESGKTEQGQAAQPSEEGGAAIDEKRRAALAVLARWTPPAMLTLMLSTRADAQGFGSPPPLPKPPKPSRPTY